MIRYALTATAICLIGSVPALAADEDSAESTVVQTAPQPNGTDLRALVLEVGGRLHKTVLLDPRVRGSVDLGNLRSRDVTYPTLLTILGLNGYSAFSSDGTIRVMPDSNARQQPLPIVDPHNIKTPDDEWVTALVVLKNVNAAQLIPVLRPLMPQAAQMACFTDRNALLMIDVSANVKRLVAIIDAVDALPATSVSRQN
jgi:general secretion pathway protein D